MTQTPCTVSYADGQSSRDYTSIQDAARSLLAEYPDGVIYDAGGFDRDGDDGDDMYDVRSGRAAMVWQSEADAVNDDGARSVAEILVAEEK